MAYRVERSTGAITVSFGALFDLLRPSEPSELTMRMEALQSAPKPQVQAVSVAA